MGRADISNARAGRCQASIEPDLVKPDLVKLELVNQSCLIEAIGKTF